MENQTGRSMIEMLGVLAIVGVLSVGGIAGYSKAMTKYRINKWAEEMHLVLQEFIKYKEDWKRFAYPEDKTVRVTKYMRDIGVFPTTWKLYTDDTEMYDSLGGIIVFAAYPSSVFFRTNIKTDRDDFEQICMHYWVDVIIPYSEAIYMIHMYGTDGESGERNSSNNYYGDAYCNTDKTCIRDRTISDIIEKCAKVEKNETMSISVYFK